MAVEEKGNGSFQLQVDKSKYEPPKTNYLNMMFAEHERVLGAVLDTKDMNQRYFERIARIYMSNLRAEARKEILGDILSEDPDKRKGKLALYKLAFEKQWKEDHGGKAPQGEDLEECRVLALIECISDAYEETAKYYQIEGNELGMMVMGLYNWDSQGHMYVMTEDMDWAFQRMKELFGVERDDIPVEKIEVPFDEQ